MKHFLICIFSFLMLSCKQIALEPKCIDKHIIIDNTVEACLLKPDEHTKALNNYNEESIGKIIEACTKVLENYKLIVPEKFNWVKVIITDSPYYYNEAYLFNTDWQYPDDIGNKDTAFYTSAGFYSFSYSDQHNTIYVNLSKDGVSVPNSIIVHELLHLVSKVNYQDIDFSHTNKFLWEDVRNDILMNLKTPIKLVKLEQLL